MSTITFGGLASGLDTNSIVTSLVAAEKVPLTALTTRKTDVDSASQAITAFSTQLSTLRTAAAALSDPNGFASSSATSSDPAVVASAGAGAVPGNYDIKINALAKEQRTYADPQSSSTAALGMSGALSIQVGNGTAVTVNVTASDSISAIASKIASSGARVSSNVIFDGQSYRMQVRGLDTGAANAVTFGESGFSLGLSNAANTSQKSQDASLTIDGFNITRSTNKVVGVVSGVTLALTNTTASAITVRVASDPAAIQSKIATFVSAYNDVVTSGHTATGYAGAVATNTVLRGDTSIRTSLDRLQSVLSAPVANATGAYTTLASIGLTRANDGTLTFNSDTFATALSADSNSVAHIFTTTTGGPAGAMSGFKTAVDALTATSTSTVSARIASLKRQSSDLSTEADTMQRHISAYEANIRQQFTNLEVLMSQTNAQMAALGGTTTNSTSGTASTNTSSG